MDEGNVPLVPGIDLEACRLSQDFASTAGVRKVLTRVQVRKPNKTEFFRVSTDSAHQFKGMVLELKEHGETYLATAAMHAALPGLLKPVELRLAVNRFGNAFIIPAPLPDADGRLNPWHESMLVALAEAENAWVRVTANMKGGCYDLLVAESHLGEPSWPEHTFQELVGIAFRNRIIDSDKHPIVQELLGQQ
jgi:hypothetical protein